MRTRFSWASVVLLWLACSDSRAPASTLLQGALSGDALGLAVQLGAASGLERDPRAGGYRASGASTRHQLRLGSKGGELRVTHPRGGGLTLRPALGPAGFATWGPAVASG